MSSMHALREDRDIAEPRSASRKQAQQTTHQVTIESSAPKDNVEYRSNEVTTDSSSPAELTYTGEFTIPITSILHIVAPEEDTPSGTWPIFRLMDENGKIRKQENDGYQYSQTSSASRMVRASECSDAKAPSLPNDDLDRLRANLHFDHPTFGFDHNPLLHPARHTYVDTLSSNNTLLRAYSQMIRLREMDNILQNAQRQGRISFYMTCRGEEGIHLGAAAALDLEDTVLAQYREAGILMWRGFTLQQFADQCFSNESDLGKGRQMPVHYGSRALNYHTISSPLGTQLPQAVGAAYRSKLQGKPNVSIAFFGEGCASTTDFHSACNFAATLRVPVIFFCRNNGYAISTPANEQYAGDGIVSRCKGYGMAGLRVDGNDLVAVSAAVHAAKQYALETSAPVLIEAMTYRQGHHSTSDDSSRYRNVEEVQEISKKSDPLLRVGAFLRNYGILGPDDTTLMEDAERLSVLNAMEKAEQKAPPPIEGLFADIYKDMPKHLKQQEKGLVQHLSMHSSNY